jgi:hypothetical protein
MKIAYYGNKNKQIKVTNFIYLLQLSLKNGRGRNGGAKLESSWPIADLDKMWAS